MNIYHAISITAIWIAIAVSSFSIGSWALWLGVPGMFATITIALMSSVSDTEKPRPSKFLQEIKAATEYMRETEKDD